MCAGSTQGGGCDEWWSGVWGWVVGGRDKWGRQWPSRFVDTDYTTLSVDVA